MVRKEEDGVDAEGEDDGAKATVLIYPPIRFQLRPYPESRIPANVILYYVKYYHIDPLPLPSEMA